MAMQTDVLASTAATSTGQIKDQGGNNLARCRVKSLYIVPTGTAGSVAFKDGGSGGTAIMTINTVASATQPTYLLLPGEGILFSTDVYAAITNVGSVTVFYA